MAKIFSFTILVILFFCSGCGLLTLDPIAKEKRKVSVVLDKDKTVTFNDSVVWGDRPFGTTRAIRFPAVTYIIEAEDYQYYYFRSPSDIEYRIFDGKKIVDTRNMPGGFFFKKKFTMLPAGAYLSISPEEKVITWRLGGNFLNMEGKQWKKNF